jgi:chaperonin GroES
MTDLIKLFKDWKPLSDRIVVVPDISEKKVGGIALADENKGDDTKAYGVVVCVGPGRFPENSIERQPMTVALGDRVMFRKHAGDEIFVDERGVIQQSNHIREGIIAARVMIEDSCTIILPI